MKPETKTRLFGMISQRAIARKLNTSQQNVSLWVTSGNFPAKRIIPFCEAVDYAVTPHQIDSVIYPNPTDGLPPDHVQLTGFSTENLIHENQHGRKQGTDRPRN